MFKQSFIWEIRVLPEVLEQRKVLKQKGKYAVSYLLPDALPAMGSKCVGFSVASWRVGTMIQDIWHREMHSICPVKPFKYPSMDPTASYFCQAVMLTKAKNVGLLIP